MMVGISPNSAGQVTFSFCLGDNINATAINVLEMEMNPLFLYYHSNENKVRL